MNTGRDAARRVFSCHSESASADEESAFSSRMPEKQIPRLTRNDNHESVTDKMGRRPDPQAEVSQLVIPSGAR